MLQYNSLYFHLTPLFPFNCSFSTYLMKQYLWHYVLLQINTLSEHTCCNNKLIDAKTVQIKINIITINNIIAQQQFKQKTMRNSFFAKGTQMQTPLGTFILAHNKLDAHHYALERIQNCPPDYVYEYYTSFEDLTFLRYYTCWEEQEIVTKKEIKEKEKQKEEVSTQDVKSNKKKTLDAFLSKKKSKQPQLAPKSESSIGGIGRSKKQLQEGNKNQQQQKQKIVYIQLQSFKQLQVPGTIEQIKNLMSVIYLLAQAVNKQTGIWPVMTPVVTSQGALRFLRKGTNRQSELVRLFQTLMTGWQIADWGKEMVNIYEMYKINGEVQFLGSKIHHDLQIIYSAQYGITLVKQGKKIEQKARITAPKQITLLTQGLIIELSEYSITFSYIDQNTREVTLQHYLEDNIGLIAPSSNFIIRYLKTFRK